MADILSRLVHAGYWGSGHQDVDQLKNWMSSHIKKNGKAVTRAIRQLKKERLISEKNMGRSIYANPGYRKEIYAFIDMHKNE